MSRFLPVGEGARNAGGAELFQPVFLDGVAFIHRFSRRHWRIRHTVFGHCTGTDRSRRRASHPLD
jgi:hypothetical protein